MKNQTIAADFSNLSDLIMIASNMVEIEALIFGEVWNKYTLLFCATDRKFNRANETQQEWVVAIDEKYGHQANAERIDLFLSIPSRFHKTELYKKLADRVYNLQLSTD
jgi:hypothetical protein